MPTAELPSASRKKEIRRSRRQHLGGIVTRGGLSHSGTAEADSSPMASASGRERLHSLTLLFFFDVAINACGQK